MVPPAKIRPLGSHLDVEPELRYWSEA